MKFGINQSISQTITQLSCIQLETPSSRLWNFWWIKTYTTFKLTPKKTPKTPLYSIPSWRVIWNYLSIPKFQRLHRWSLGMDNKFHPTLYWPCDYLSMLGWKLIHVSKRASGNSFMLITRWLRHDLHALDCIITHNSNNATHQIMFRTRYFDFIAGRVLTNVYCICLLSAWLLFVFIVSNMMHAVWFILYDLCEGNQPLVDSPHKVQVCGRRLSVMISCTFLSSCRV